jgi:hypothetical protein
MTQTLTDHRLRLSHDNYKRLLKLCATLDAQTGDRHHPTSVANELLAKMLEGKS